MRSSVQIFHSYIVIVWRTQWRPQWRPFTHISGVPSGDQTITMQYTLRKIRTRNIDEMNER